MANNIVGLDLNLDQEYIAASVQSVVKAAIVQALGNKDEIIRKAIDSTIDCYVDEQGRKVQKGTWRSVPFLDWIAEKTVEDTVRECFVEIVNENKEEFKAEIIKQINSKKWKEGIAKAFLSEILSSAENKYQMPITVEFQQQRE